MQGIEIGGLDKIETTLNSAPDVIREAKARVLEKAGAELLESVRSRIGGTGRVAGAQEYRIGSGKGYVAVRAKASTNLDGYAAGYITNALENGHDQEPGMFIPKIGAKLRRDRVPGKYMYQMTGKHDAGKIAEMAAQEIEDSVSKALEK